MRYARDDRAKTLVDAHTIGERARSRSLSCPTCGARVHYRSSVGLSPDPVFAHNPHEGKPDCENYHPWDGTGVISLLPSPSRRSRPLAVEDSPDEFGLCLEDGDTWNLYLRLPELAVSEIGSDSLRNLAKAYVEVDVASTSGRLSLIELRPGVGAARLVVPPVAGSYRTTTGGSWPAAVPKRRWEAHTRGLNPRGTLFRFHRGEWVRLADGSAVEFGEDLRVVAEQRNAPPRECDPVSRKLVTSRGQTWVTWRVRMPAASSAADRWLESLGFEIIAAAWKIRIASLPVAINASQLSIFATRQPIIAVLKAPQPGARADVTLESPSSRVTETIRTVSPADTAWVTFSLPWPGSHEIRAHYDDRSLIGFETDNSDDLWDLKDGVNAVPALQLSIGDAIVRSWEVPTEIPMPRQSEAVPLIVVSPNIDEVRFDLSWESTQSSGIADSISAEVLIRRLTALIEARSSVSVQIDGRGLGNLRFALRRAEKQNTGTSDAVARRISFLSHAPGVADVATTPTPAWLRRRACALDDRLASAVARGVDRRWAAVLTKMVRESD